MKKLLAWLGKALGGLLVILGSVVVLPLLLLEWLMETPVDVMIWLQSPYRRDFGGKYRWMMTQWNDAFQMYNAIQREKLPIRFIPDKTGAADCSGWFVHGDTLILPEEGWAFDDQNKRWTFEENDETVVLNEAWVRQKLDGCCQADGTVCSRAVVLISEDELPGGVDTQIGQPPVARVMPLPFGWYGHEYRQALRKLMAAVQ